jgi:predicted HicB family RNase H-like nuclease
MTRRNIDIPDELWHCISIEAAKQKKSKRQLVIDALKEYKERRKNK